MYLRNRFNGELEEFSDIQLIDKNGIDWEFYSITDLVSQYEDVKEKYGWFIDIYGYPNFISKTGNESTINRLRRRGNYFKTREEAEEVAVKVRALLLEEKERRNEVRTASKIQPRQDGHDMGLQSKER